MVRDRDETETFGNYVSRPSRDRDVETETTSLVSSSCMYNRIFCSSLYLFVSIQIIVYCFMSSNYIFWSTVYLLSRIFLHYYQYMVSSLTFIT